MLVTIFFIGCRELTRAPAKLRLRWRRVQPADETRLRRLPARLVRRQDR
jgi:hypothetical protein